MKIKTLDLFCGAGGSSWGAVKADAEIVMGVDGGTGVGLVEVYNLE